MIRETSIPWPEDKLGCPLRATYGGRVEPRFARSEVADGPARFRRIRTEERRTLTLTFAWSLQQLQLWESFHDSTLAGGVRWFQMNHLTGGGLVPMYCHMLEGWTFAPLEDAHGYVQVEFEVEAYHGPTSRPPAGIASPPLSGGQALQPAPAADRINGRLITEGRPGDVINARGPGAIA